MFSKAKRENREAQSLRTQNSENSDGSPENMLLYYTLAYAHMTMGREGRKGKEAGSKMSTSKSGNGKVA